MRAVAVSRPEDIPGLAEGYDAVGIDEVQFFAPEIVLVIDILVARGTRVVAAGLDQDFRGRPFGAMPELLCRAEFVDKLQAVCHRCGGPATMTQRLVDGVPAPADGATIVVGALDSYEARCRACHEIAEPALEQAADDASIRELPGSQPAGVAPSYIRDLFRRNRIMRPASPRRAS